MKTYNYKVVCGFNGTIYYRSDSLKNCERGAARIRKSLKKPQCGSLASYVQIVDGSARFTNIIPADNEFGCCQVSQKRWVD